MSPIKTEPLPSQTVNILRARRAALEDQRGRVDEAYASLCAAIIAAASGGGGLAAIGEEVGLTKARVHQIVSAAR